MRNCPFRDVTTCGRENLESMAARKSQHCGDKSHLLAEYNRSVLEWSNALRNLGEKPDDTEFAVLLAKVDEARAKTRRAEGFCRLVDLSFTRREFATLKRHYKSCKMRGLFGIVICIE